MLLDFGHLSYPNNSTCIQHQRHLFRMVEPGWVDLSWDLCCSWVSFVHGSHIIPSTTYGWVGEENKTMGGRLPGHLSQNGTHGKQSTHQPLSMLNCSAGNSGAPFPFPTIPHASNTRDIFFGWWNLVGLTSAGICAAAGSPLCMVRTLYPLLQLRDLHALFADLSSFLRRQEHVVRLVVVPAAHRLPGQWWSAGGHVPVVVHDPAVEQPDEGGKSPVVSVGPFLHGLDFKVHGFQGALLVLLCQGQFGEEVISDFLHVPGLIIDGPHFIVFLRAVEVRDEGSVGVDRQAFQSFGRVLVDHVGLPAPKVGHLWDGPPMPDVP